MAVINLLTPQLADMIAAGEVVERPGSVVKELLENAVDAGAKNIQLELRGGGTTFIRVTDDGCGMEPDDAGNCFLRHATSKLRDAAGLEAIGTLGFRGEALAAISAVSRVELQTRRKGAAEGVRVTVLGGEIQDMTPCGCPEGTTFTVRDLFYNTPARLKFMKTDRTEGSTCALIALKTALSRPDISIRCVRDGKEEFYSPGDGTLRSAVYALLGREAAGDMLECDGGAGDVTVTGFVSSPRAGRGNRSAQYFFVNGRPIHSLTMQTALEQAYKNTLLVGRYPSCVLHISLAPGLVDVNVHPTKNEVKFSKESVIFDAVYHTVKAALENEKGPLDMGTGGTARKPEARPANLTAIGRGAAAPAYTSSVPSGRGAAPAAPRPKNLWSMPANASETPERPYRQTNLFTSSSRPTEPVSDKKEPSPIVPSRPAAPEAPMRAGRESYAPKAETVREPKAAEVPAALREAPAPERRETPAADKKPIPDHPVPERVQVKMPEEEKPGTEQSLCPPTPQPAEEKAEPEEVSWTVIGEVMNTYIVVDLGQSMLLIDKHAAHERIIFDRLKARDTEIMSQQLLIPITWHAGPTARERAEKNAEALAAMGFELEEFGTDDMIIRALPADMDAADGAAALEEICEKLKPDVTSARDEILHTVACKAAIKAGWHTEPAEREALVRKVVSGEVRYCPHGRPVSAVMSRKELDKLFKRIV